MSTQANSGTKLVENLEKRVLFSAIEVSDFGARPNDGQDDRGAIQEAINAAQPGDTVFFADGGYDVNGQVTLKSGINITGEHEQNASLNFNVPVNPGDSNSQNFAFSGWGVHDFSFTNLRVRSNNGIFFVSNSYNPRFTDNDFQWGYAGNYYNRLAFFGSGHQDGMRIEENFFHDSPDSDRNVELWGLKNSSYSYNRFDNVNDGGHIMEAESNVTLSFNSGTRLHRMGLEVQGNNRATGLVVEGNSFSDWRAPWNDTFGLSVMMMYSPDTKIINNYLSADFSGDWGVSAQGAGGPRFGIGIEAGLSGGEVSGNVVGGPHPWATAVACSQPNTLVKNNRFFGNSLWATVMGEPGSTGVGSAVQQDNKHLPHEQMPAAKKIKAGPSSMTGTSKRASLPYILRDTSTHAASVNNNDNNE